MNTARSLICALFCAFVTTVTANAATLVAAWPSYQHDATHNAVFDGDLSASWTFSTGGKINGGLAIADGAAFVASFDKHVYAVDLESGKVRWTSARFSNIVMSTPIVAGGLVVVGTGSNALMHDQEDSIMWGVPDGDVVAALDVKTGRTVWTYHTQGEDMASAALAGNALIFGNGDMHAYALDLKTGQRIWSSAIPGISAMASTAVSGNTAYLLATMGAKYSFRSDHTHTVAVDVRTGHVLWSAPYGNSDCSPTVAGGVVFIEGTRNIRTGSDNGFDYRGYNSVYALNAETGAMLWSFETNLGIFTTLGSNERAIAGTYNDGMLIQALPVVNKVNAFDAHTGAVLWTVETSGPVKMSPVVREGKVYFGDTTGMFYTVDQKTGRIANLESFSFPFATSPPVIYGHTMLFADGSDLIAMPVESF